MRGPVRGTVPAGPDHVLLCYRAAYRAVGSADDAVMYISSLRVRFGRNWRNSFSRDTPARVQAGQTDFARARLIGGEMSESH